MKIGKYQFIQVTTTLQTMGKKKISALMILVPKIEHISSRKSSLSKTIEDLLETTKQ